MTKLGQALLAIRAWGARQWLIAIVAAAATALLIGFATVLVPNDFFRRDVAPEPWNVPVLLLTAALTGLLVGSYVAVPGQEETAVEGTGQNDRRGRFGWLGTVLAWFAVGCPVCNKIALLALGYSGALTYFAPMQPFLAVAAVVLLLVALTHRLAGQVACPVPATAQTAA